MEIMCKKLSGSVEEEMEDGNDKFAFPQHYIPQLLLQMEITASDSEIA